MNINRRTLLRSAGAAAGLLLPARAFSDSMFVPPMVFPSNRCTNLFEYGNSATTHAYMTGNGTSSPTYNSTRSGLSVMLEAMSQGSLRIAQPLTQISGWTGQTTAYLLANFNTNVAPYFSTFDWLLMWACANNDYAVSGLTPAQSLANIQAIQAQCAAAGKLFLLGTPFLPRTGGNAYTTQSGEYAAWGNDIIGTWARRTPGVIYFDFWDDIVDPTSTTGTPGTNMWDTDGLHPASLAVATVAKRCLATLGSLVPPAPNITNGPLDFYDPAKLPDRDDWSASRGACYNDPRGQRSSVEQYLAHDLSELRVSRCLTMG